MTDYFAESLKLHEQTQGKVSIISKVPLKNRHDLSIAYTPGVAEPCRRIADDKMSSYRYTSKGNMVAVVSNGTAVLGLGNIGPDAAMPVMEGKAVLFKEFGGVDACPICIDAKTPTEIIQVVRAIAPSFGGINLEDIASPDCFVVEETLENELDIPVFHDDQHGTAIVTTAALLNAMRLIKKDIRQIKVILNGPGAAGTAIIKMLLATGVKNIVACDEYGILYQEREQGIIGHKQMLCKITNQQGLRGTLADALTDADVFIGVSKPETLTPAMVQTMAPDPVIFAMANPVPEIMPDIAKAAGARIVGTGRSDFPNQINNVLAFPGIFKGALAVQARDINYRMKVAAAQAIAGLITEDDLREDYIIPDVFDSRVAQAVADATAAAARETGVARR